MPQNENESRYAPCDPDTLHPIFRSYHQSGTIPWHFLPMSVWDEIVISVEEKQDVHNTAVEDDQDNLLSVGYDALGDADRTTHKTYTSSLAEQVQEKPVSSGSGRSNALLPPKTRRHASEGTAAVHTNRKYLTPGSVSTTAVINTNRPQVPDTTPGQVLTGSNLRLCDREKVTRPNRKKAKSVSSGVRKTRKGSKGTVVKTKA